MGVLPQIHFALMRALVVVVAQPVVQIGLKRVDAVLELLAERDLVTLLQDGLVEALTTKRTLPIS